METISNKQLENILRKFLPVSIKGINKYKIIYRPYITPFKELLNIIPAQANVFDIGCGNGAFLNLVKELKQPQALGGVEISKTLVDNANSLLASSGELNNNNTTVSINITQYDGTNLPDLSAYQFVFLIDVLHHIPKHQLEVFFKLLKSKMSKEATLVLKDIDAGKPLLCLFNKMHDMLVSQEIGNEISLKKAKALLQQTALLLNQNRTKECYYTLTIQLLQVLKKIQNFLLLLRVEQWLKNLLVFSPVFFAAQIENPSYLLKLILIFISFSLVASSVYIINDLNDIEKDKLHPEKMHRAIASGKIKSSEAKIWFCILMPVGLLLAYLESVYSFYFVFAYLIINILYSTVLKNVALVDLIVVSSGFILRILAGGFAVSIILSNWLILITFLLSVFILFAKRRDDLTIKQKSGNHMRSSLKGYNFEFVNAGILISATVLVVAYIMYTLSADVLSRPNGRYVYFTSFIVFIGVLRYLQLTFVFEKSGNPIKTLLKDKFLLLLIIIWIVSLYLLMYEFKK
ncbi:MAG: UbiA family prenyltransferase [Ferruginibacter sp.]